MWPFNIKENMQKEYDKRTQEIHESYEKANSKPFNEFTRQDLNLMNADNFMIYMNDEINKLKAEIEVLRGK